MIVGDGLMATACRDREDVLFFASGVSDSKETDVKKFQREEDLLLANINHDKIFVYFGAIGGGDEYLEHKFRMKSIIMNSVKRYIILNLTQVVGKGGNKDNLFNAFRRSLLNGEEITIYKNCIRSLVDIDDVMNLLDNLIDNKNYGIHNFYGIEPLPVSIIIQLMKEAVNEKGYTKNLINKYL